MPRVQSPEPSSLALSERYVRLVLAVGQHDADYVDAYYGPPEWQPAAGDMPRPLAALHDDAEALAEAIDGGAGEALAPARRAFLRAQVRAVEARLRMLAGEHLSFDEESRALYDAVAPTHPDAWFDDALSELASLVPGAGPLVERFDRYRSAFAVPRGALDRVFGAAIDHARAVTRGHIPLPEGERFTVEYVTGKAWSGYNWYKGGAASLIQVNTDLPVYVDRAVDLACHEGYPGHHVYNALIEQHLVGERGWVEFSVYPLFSPQSLIAEGTANFGIEVALPGEARTAFERDVLYPIAGFDAGRAREYAAVLAVVNRLSYAGNEAARRYLDGQIGRDEAIGWLEHHALMPRPRAEQRVRFFEQYRSYVINYNLGQDMVRAFIERRGGTADAPAVRWAEFAALLSSPLTPSSLLGP
jgi:hypothetical protein